MSVSLSSDQFSKNCDTARECEIFSGKEHSAHAFLTAGMKSGWRYGMVPVPYRMVLVPNTGRHAHFHRVKGRFHDTIHHLSSCGQTILLLPY
eukprot:scaffold6555_cov182-Amphora_coffeaeformis.AAC.4